MVFTFEETLQKRFACKAFTDKEIQKDDLDFILEAGRLAPSSCGFEPWKFVVLSKKEDNEALSKLCFNQENVATASHNIIILARTDLQAKDEYARKQVARFCSPNVDKDKFQQVLNSYTGATNAMNEEQLYAYANNQCHLALMQMATAAMVKGIDSCMIGGFEKAKVDEYLRLNYPFQTAVILSLGYRKNEPKYKKQRLKIEEVVEYR